jgi:glycosyltransferase involved in cell wall biosynthesis
VPKEIVAAAGPVVTDAGSLVVVIPVFNDWPALALLLPRLDEALLAAGVSARVVLVDDGSTQAMPREALVAFGPRALSAVQVLRLRRNLGHQRAIAIALTYVEQRTACRAAVVMDGDGEDDPRDIAKLLAGMPDDPVPTVVFAARRKRAEGLVFRFFYFAYRALHRALTGIPVNVGNFSVVPREALRSLVVVSEMWNHYAAAVFRARIPHRSVPTARASRLAGQPTMNFVSLVGHGLSAFAVHGEVIGVRLLVATTTLIVVAAALLATIVGVRLFTDAVIPGWASTVGGITVALLVQLLTIALLLTGLTLVGRSNASFIPLRDYAYFVDAEDVIHGGWQSAEAD